MLLNLTCNGCHGDGGACLPANHRVLMLLSVLAQGSDTSVGRHLRDNIVASALQQYVNGIGSKLDMHGMDNLWAFMPSCSKVVFKTVSLNGWGMLRPMIEGHACVTLAAVNNGSHMSMRGGERMPGRQVIPLTQASGA